MQALSFCRCLLLVAIALCAQDRETQPRPEIYGVVADPGVNREITGAEITVHELPSGNPVVINTRTEIGKIVTDPQGAFRFPVSKFGKYLLRVRKEGYSSLSLAGNPLTELFGPQVNVTLDSEHPAREVRLSLGRTGQLSGRVIDADSGEPVVKVYILAVPFFYQNGLPQVSLGRPVSTDAEGRFTASGLVPGRYLARVQSMNLGQFQKEFSDDDAKVIDRDYEKTYWPGGGGLDVALAVTVPSGGFGDVGTIRMRKTPLYRVRLSIPAAGCVAGRMVNVNVDTMNSVEAACGKDYLVRNLPPGSHVFSLYGNGPPDLRRYDSIPVELKDKNLEVTAAMHLGVDLQGQFIFADGAKPFPFDRLQARTRPIGGFSFSDELQPVKPDAQGKFGFVNLPFGKRKLDLIGVESGYYVKEVRYNGIAIADNIFTQSDVGSLQIVIDDKPAVLSGVVSDGDRPVSQPYLVLCKWPAPPANITGGEDGRFQIAGLAPGEYRIFAVSQADKAKLDEPRVLDRLLAAAEKIALAPRGFQNLSLKLTNVQASQ